MPLERNKKSLGGTVVDKSETVIKCLQLRVTAFIGLMITKNCQNLYFVMSVNMNDLLVLLIDPILNFFFCDFYFLEITVYWHLLLCGIEDLS